MRRLVAGAGVLLLPVIGLVDSPPLSAQFTAFEQAIARFDAAVAQGVADDAAGAVSVAVFEGPRVVWTKGYGWADIEHRVPARADTIGRTGSISKSFTAVLVMQLVERGVLALDDPVRTYLPEIGGLSDRPDGALPITFRMLASHTAGLVREPALEGAASGSIYGWERKVLDSIPHTAFRTPPRSEYSYSNIGFGILGLAASRAAGVPFMDLVARQIFQPLGMTSSTFIVNTPDLLSRLSVGYSRNRETAEVSAERATREHFGHGYKVPNGGIYATVGDLAAFAAALMGDGPVQILTRDSRHELFTPQPPAGAYGLGFQIEPLEGGGAIVGHGGSVAGYNADLRFHRASRLGVAMLRTTTYDPPVSALLQALITASR